MHPSAFAMSLRPQPYGSAGPRWVVAQAAAELVARYGFLDDGELGLTAAMFDPPAGVFLMARTESRGEPVGGAGLRTVATGTGEVRRLSVGPAWRGQGIGRDLMAGTLYEAMGWERIFVTPEGASLPAGWIRFRKVVGGCP